MGSKLVLHNLFKSVYSAVHPFLRFPDFTMDRLDFKLVGFGLKLGSSR